MSKHLITHWDKIKMVSSIKNIKIRKLLLTEFSNDPTFCRAIKEIALNTVKKNIPLNPNL